MERIRTYVPELGTVEMIVNFGLYKGELSEIEIDSITINDMPFPVSPELVYKLSRVAEIEFYKTFADKYEYGYGLREG